ncbi:MAG: hypothetical protein ABI068_04115 [Ktedonobacterales bacterium]
MVARGAWGSFAGTSRGSTVKSLALMLALLLALTLAGCSFGGDSNASGRGLTQIPWCDQPLISFQDDSTSAQTLTSDWSSVKTELGFTPYLPPTLPNGSCLDLAGGSIHDPIFGARLSITYTLPSNVSLSFSEAPKRGSLSSSVQYATSSQVSGTTLCIGSLKDTTITIASNQSQGNVQTLFTQLKPNVDWLPATTPATSTAPTATTAS